MFLIKNFLFIQFLKTLSVFLDKDFVYFKLHLFLGILSLFVDATSKVSFPLCFLISCSLYIKNYVFYLIYSLKWLLIVLHFILLCSSRVQSSHLQIVMKLLPFPPKFYAVFFFLVFVLVSSDKNEIMTAIVDPIKTYGLAVILLRCFFCCTET